MPASFADLVELMRRLRAPDGCPWDREQTYATLAPMLLEEAYEAFEAVEEAREGNPQELRDELGDLLFQIVFYAQVAKERGEFTIDDVTDAIHAKMVRRHPHVFGNESAEDTAAVLKNWEAIKAEEKRAAGKETDKEASLLEGVSLKVPALMEAHQLSTKAARVGFDWRDVDEIFDKLHEEIDELRAAIRERAKLERRIEAERSGAASDENAAFGDEANAIADSWTRDALDDEANAASLESLDERCREEVGDLLFAAVNIARHLKIEPEAALKLTNRKFRRRFRHIERELQRQGRTPDQSSLDEMETLWQQAKMND